MRAKKEGAGTTLTPNSDLATATATSGKSNQMPRVLAVFKKQPSTMLMVSVEVEVLRANICRYVAQWKKQHRIILTHYGICPISKHRAGFYSADLERYKAQNLSHETE